MPKLLTEKFVQDHVIEYLSRKGWSRNLRARNLKEHGVDIKVRNNKYARYWLIEVKSERHKEVNFTLAIGQIITRMHRDGKRGYKYGSKYGVAFPHSYQNIVLRRLPYDVCDKLNLYVFFVDNKGKTEVFDWKKIQAKQTNN